MLAMLLLEHDVPSTVSASAMATDDMQAMNGCEWAEMEAASPRATAE